MKKGSHSSKLRLVAPSPGRSQSKACPPTARYVALDQLLPRVEPYAHVPPEAVRPPQAKVRMIMEN